MSRCFPYPPPKYDGAEIESIKPELTIDLVALKLLKEQEKAKEKNRRKEKKRDKKEKKAALKELENSEHSKHELKKRKYEESTTKTPNSSAEQLERSGLTEELELPYATRAADNSPERSQDSNKRRKLAPSPGPSQSNNNGIILRIKLPTVKHAQRDTELPAAAAFPLANLMVPERAVVLKQREPELTRLQQQGGDFEPCVRKEQNECSTNFRYKQDDSQPALIPQCKASDQQPQPACKEEEPCFSSRSGEAIPLKSEDGRAHSRRKLSRIEKKERQLMDLIMNWNPSPLEQFEDSDLVDQEWLFASSSRPSKAKPGNDGTVGKEEGFSSHENGVDLSLQPRACYLPELGIYQLPYVIPY